MKSLSILFLLIGILGIVAFSQTYSISAKPLYLSLYSTFTVFNVVNTTYVGIKGYINYTIDYVVANTWIEIEIVNFTTHNQIASLTAYFTSSDSNYIYYDPSLNSVIFFINISSDKPVTIPISTLRIPGPLYNVNGEPVSNVTIIPLGYLVNVDGTPINETQVFQQYLNGTSIIKSMINGLAGYYVLYFYG
ncbi:hypothetical protein SJAV_00580 [Sulfurisphaera javensis]|uniref:Uncharacterized protein n=1 Tax=Sulfurisphaera javensis TaxID=2049879 RepID=A0AAT9GMJ1_9CREN